MSVSRQHLFPSGWSRRRLRFDVRTNPVKSELDLPDDTEVSFVPMDAVGELGGLRLDQTRELADTYNGYTYFADGDVCVAKITPCFENGKGAIAEGLTNGVAFGTTELHVLRPSPTLDGRFLFYLTIAHDFRSYGESEMLGAGGQKRVPEGFLKDWIPPLPHIEVQQRIARFLDEKTARIDALIEKKQVLLERLAEKRQALITRAVTKGLNPDVAMKPSGVDWLGDIPAHWEIKRLSFISSVIDCKHRTPEYIDDGIALVSTSEIKPYSIDYESKRRVSEAEFQMMSEGGRRPVVGDIIYSRNASVGSAAMVRSNQEICLGQDLCLIRPKAFHAAYLEFFQNSGVSLEQLNQELVGATFKRVNVDAVKKYFTLVPPMSEQIGVVEYLEHCLRSEDAIQACVIQSLELLLEHRSTLITAAVTGQLPELNG